MFPPLRLKINSCRTPWLLISPLSLYFFICLYIIMKMMICKGSNCFQDLFNIQRIWNRLPLSLFRKVEGTYSSWTWPRNTILVETLVGSLLVNHMMSCWYKWKSCSESYTIWMISSIQFLFYFRCSQTINTSNCF